MRTQLNITVSVCIPKLDLELALVRNERRALIVLNDVLVALAHVSALLARGLGETQDVTDLDQLVVVAVQLLLVSVQFGNLGFQFSKLRLGVSTGPITPRVAYLEFVHVIFGFQGILLEYYQFLSIYLGFSIVGFYLVVEGFQFSQHLISSFHFSDKAALKGTDFRV